MSFRDFRNVEISTVEFLRTQINANFTGVTVVKAYKQADEATLPVICVRLLDIFPITKEIGSTVRKNQFSIVIDIFATSDGQRLDLASFVTETLNGGWVYNEYTKSSGTGESLDGVANGRVRVMTYTQNSRVDFGEEVHAHDRFRHIISILTERSGV